MAKKDQPLRAPKIFRIMHARPKLVLSAIVGIGVIFMLPPEWRLATRSLIGWDAGIGLYLCIVYWIVARSEVSHIRQHAKDEDEGRILILVLIVAATLASFAAIIALLGQESTGQGQGGHKIEPLQMLLAIGTILLSWAFVHSIFAIHYAHEFYTESPPAGGLDFPGDKKPDYWDFVYFSFVIGMTFQVSDVAVTSRSIRHAVTAHGIVSFLFNVALLAITVNVAASAI
jgi:uncharacterized membrane protein